MGQMHSIGQYISEAGIVTPFSATAGGSNDAVAQNGAVIDRTLFNNPLSCVVVGIAQSTLTATKTNTVSIKLQDSADGVTFADFGSAPANLVQNATGANVGQIIGKYNLTAARRYIRAVMTMDLSNTTTDTAIGAAIVILGGEAELPAA